MSTDAQGEVSTGDTAPAGVIIGSMPRHGERAKLIRRIATSYPELSQQAIANKVGCSVSNVYQVLRKFSGDYALEDIQEFQANEADILDTIRHRTFASITQADLDKASLLQKVTAGAILLDKSRLLNGQPTSIHVTALVDLVGLLRSEQASDE